MDPAYGGTMGGVQGLVDGGQVPGSIPGHMLADGTEVPLSDSGYNIQPGEWLGPAPTTGTANVAPAPASLPPALPSLQ